ncbi:beta-ketoacyl-[acyl-carrier-protein] synthase family protein [Lichenicoccus sp.]|uniref:beta-ketoacyl-[acyl-carrier-protein] synthase family protein n=1 Tax=Lichenicoccus sp. TaxID=2781899 RepID=UPI003D102356
MNRRVAITGIGGIAATGNDIPRLWTALKAGICGIGPITNIPTERLTARVAAEIKGFNPPAHFEPKRLALLDRGTQLALVATREAVRDAGIDTAAAGGRGGAVLAAALGHDSLDATYKSFYGDGASRVHPFTVPRAMPSGAASHISMEFGLRGPTMALASACASSNHAIGYAFQMVRAGMLDLAITGGADASVVVGFLKSWEALRVLSPDVCRPFSLGRAGLVIGEGGAMFVLEAWDAAVARGAAIHAELIGFGCSADAGDITAPSAAGAAASMQAALADAGLPSAAIGYVNAHGTGTRLNDRTEVAALRMVFGDHLPKLPVSSTKSMLGHCMTASGALELVATVLALRDGVLPPTIGFTALDPECDIDCVPNASRACAVEFALSNSLAFGGLNATLVARRASARPHRTLESA